ncbi:MAG: aminopeptidase P family protein, partial [Gammaproteobacteria bacterium]
MFVQRIKMLTERMCERGVDLALITDDDSVYYFTGFYDYLHMEFGRPT